MSEESREARDTLDEAREMREHEDRAKEHDSAEQREAGSGADDPDEPRPFGVPSQG